MDINITSSATQQATSAQLDRLAHDYLGVPTSLDDEASAGCRQGDTFTLPTAITATDGVYSDTQAAFKEKGVTISGTQYQRILDPAVLSVLLSNFTHAAEGKFTAAEFKAITSIGTLFKSNTDIVAFPEMSLLTLSQVPSFNGCTSLKKIGMSRDYCAYFNDTFASVASSQILNGSLIKNVFMPNFTTIYAETFSRNTNLRLVDFGTKTTNITGTLYFCSNANVIIRSTTEASVNGNASNFKTLYVPEDLVDTYKADSNWSLVGNIFPIGGTDWQTAMASLAQEEGYTLPADKTFAYPYIDYLIYGLTPPQS